MFTNAKVSNLFQVSLNLILIDILKTELIVQGLVDIWADGVKK